MKPLSRSLAVALSALCLLLAVRSAAAERVVYKRTSDRDLGLLTKPQGWTVGDRRPAIIFFFNGGWKEAGAAKPQFEEQARYFAARGMVVGQADYREKGKGGPTSAKCVEDIFSGVRWLRSHAAELGVDPRRIAAVGGSGSIHLPAAALQADAVRTPGEDASIDPLPGAMFLFNPDPDVLEPAMMRKLVEGGPAKRAGAVPPMVIYYGSRDAVAPPLDEFIAQARQAGLPVEKYIGDGGVHGFFKFTPGLEKTVAHMDRRLCALGLLSDEPKAELPHKAGPPDYEQRILATQQRWLEQHNQLAKQRIAVPQAKPAELRAHDILLPEPSAPKKATPSATPPPASQVYKTVGERTLHVVLHFPPDWKSADTRPAIVFFSGGGFHPNDKETGQPQPTAEARAKDGPAPISSGPGRGFAEEAEYFAQRGLVGIRVEYRKRKTDGVLPDKAIEDAKSAVRWVRANAARLGIDPNRIVSCGGSSGGHLAASVAALEQFDSPGDDLRISTKPNAMMLHFPLLDFLEGGTRNMPFLAALDGDKVLGERISPARHWRADLPPTLVLIGTKDPMFESVKSFVAKWKDAGGDLALYIGEGGGHGFSTTDAWRQRSLARMEEFLRKVGCFDHN